MNKLAEIFPTVSASKRQIVCHVTIIEARVMAGELLYHALRQAAPELHVELVESLDDVKHSPPSILFYSFVNRGCDVPSMEKALLRFRERFRDYTMVIITDTASEEIAASMKKHGVENWLDASAGFDALVATVRNATKAPFSRMDDDAEAELKLVESPPPRRHRALLGLTVKEQHIIELLHEGKSNKLIAHSLACSESTVKAHIANMMRKLRLHNRTQLALVYRSGAEQG